LNHDKQQDKIDKNNTTTICLYKKNKTIGGKKTTYVENSLGTY